MLKFEGYVTKSDPFQLVIVKAKWPTECNKTIKTYTQIRHDVLTLTLYRPAGKFARVPAV